MTSGTFHSIEISAIQKGPRQREELSDVLILADSIRRLGLINPILVSRELRLIAGERRLEACRSLGWTHINGQYEDEIDPERHHLLELEENTQRVDLTWQEQALAIQKYHEIRLGDDPGWGREQTAAALGISQATLSEKLAVASEVSKGNKAVAEAPKYSTARGLVARAAERRQSAEVSQILEIQEIKRSRFVLNEDFLQWAPAYSGQKFNFIHCDFPYGINADKQQQGYGPGGHGEYSDTPEDYWFLVASLLQNWDRLAQEQCHLMFWFSMEFYHETFQELSTRLTVNPFPLVWVKSDNIGLLPDPERGPRRIYETAFLATAGDRKIVRAVSNAVAVPRGANTHMSQKAPGALAHFFRMFVDESTSLLDPTCGSGSALRAAKDLGAGMVLGLEKDKDFAERAQEAMEKTDAT